MSDASDVAKAVQIVAEAAEVGIKLIDAGLDFIKAQKSGDAEQQRQALLRANRIASDEIARREANS